MAMTTNQTVWARGVVLVAAVLAAGCDDTLEPIMGANVFVIDDDKAKQATVEPDRLRFPAACCADLLQRAPPQSSGEPRA